MPMVNGLPYDYDTDDEDDESCANDHLTSHLKQWVKRRSSYKGKTCHFYPPDPALPASTQPIYTTRPEPNEDDSEDSDGAEDSDAEDSDAEENRYVWYGMDGHQLSEWSFECSINDASYPLSLFRRPGSDDHFDLVAPVEAFVDGFFDSMGRRFFEDILEGPGSLFPTISVSAIHSPSGFSTSLHDGPLLRSSDVKKETLTCYADDYDDETVEPGLYVTKHSDPTFFCEHNHKSFAIAYASFSTDRGLVVSI
ncbi:hypothetical protein TrST_g3121 [Triparma strigata]|uniref:Uncharacterized protein n=1 Tax=Triparma strigata TaxID=1606541 RepID=A0A9W7C603_9STRA|nr:hypothetical protein TrST_g3121 [Triparma strigata]